MEFRNEVFPIGIIIVNNLKSLKKDYYDENREEIEDDEEFEALTINVRDKKTNHLDVAIIYPKNSEIALDTISHESFHIAQNLCEIMNIEYQEGGTNETYAYLCGWAAKCIGKYLKVNLK